MTFDELEQRIDQLQRIAGYKTRGEVNTPIYSGLEVHQILSELNYSLRDLRERYAATVEMTPNEYEAYKYYKENPDNYANPLAQWILSLYEDVSGADDYGMYDGYDVDNQKDIIRIVHAWDYPEVIKVVD